MSKTKTSAKRAGGTSTPKSRGAYGSKRGTADKQNARRRSREQNGRVQSGMAEARIAQDKLEQLIREQSKRPAMGATEGAAYARREKAIAKAAREAQVAADRALQAEQAEKKKPGRKPVQKAATFVWEGEPRAPWSIGGARQLLRAGYTVEYVMKRTGVGYKWLDDIAIDDEHRVAVA